MSVLEVTLCWRPKRQRERRAEFAREGDVFRTTMKVLEGSCFAARATPRLMFLRRTLCTDGHSSPLFPPLSQHRCWPDPLRSQRPVTQSQWAGLLRAGSRRGRWPGRRERSGSSAMMFMPGIGSSVRALQAGVPSMALPGRPARHIPWRRKPVSRFSSEVAPRSTRRLP
jgi:hypothetical protein